MIELLLMASGVRAALATGPVCSAPSMALSRAVTSRLRGSVRLSTAMPSADTPSTRELIATALSTPSSEVDIRAVPTVASAWEGDLLIALVRQPSSEDAKCAELTGDLSALDEKLEGVLASTVCDLDFKGKPGDVRVITLAPKYGVKKVALVGVGKAAAEDATTTTSVGAASKWGKHVAKTARGEKAVTAAVALPTGLTSAEIQSGVEAIMVGLVADERYKDRHEAALKTVDERKLKLTTLQLLGVPSGAADAVARGLSMASAILLTKSLVSSPANYLTPTALALMAERIAQECGLELKVLERDECEKRGMGAYLGVAQGAVEPPKFIHLTYKPQGEAKKRIAYIGKGLTFDSGGYNIKAGAGSMIEKMKFDMGGAGAVLGAARAVGSLKPEGVEVHFIVAACENMVSERAMRPGDILTASNDKTIEVINTDAEGRLTLADALVYAEALGGGDTGAPALDAIVDVATLTGAIIIALGDKYAGFWTSCDKLGSGLETASKDVGEQLWRMPLASEYAEELKSPIADLKNVGGRGGSSITAALFLKEFVKEVPWAHIDIAGTVWSDKDGGATGFGVRTLYRFAEDIPKGE